MFYIRFQTKQNKTNKLLLFLRSFPNSSRARSRTPTLGEDDENGDNDDDAVESIRVQEESADEQKNSALILRKLCAHDQDDAAFERVIICAEGDPHSITFS